MKNKEFSKTIWVSAAIFLASLLGLILISSLWTYLSPNAPSLDSLSTAVAAADDATKLQFWYGPERQ